jgi:hypothetical protein
MKLNNILISVDQRIQIPDFSFRGVETGANERFSGEG